MDVRLHTTTIVLLPLLKLRLGSAWSLHLHIPRQTVTVSECTCVSVCVRECVHVCLHLQRTECEVTQCREVMTGQLTQEIERQIEGEIQSGRDVVHFPIVSESLLWSTQTHTLEQSVRVCERACM